MATVTPIFVAVFLTCVIVETFHSYEKSRAEISYRLGTLAASQSIILAESIARKDTNQLSLMLASIISEPDLVGIAVYDVYGSIMDSFGALDSDDTALVKSISVNYADGTDVQRVGALKLVMTDRYALQEIRTQLIHHIILGLILLVSALFASVFAHRRTVVRPLGKLLSAINNSRGNALEKVDWKSDDEIGRLITSYNEMQLRLESYERELQTAREQLEQRVEERTHALELARENAVDANRVKSKFMSSMSHEFRTPMNAILGFTQVLQMSPEAAENPRLLDRLGKIEQSAHNLMELIDQIMEYTRLESADDELHLERVAPATVVGDAVALAAPLAESRNITMSPVKADAEAGSILADPFKLRKALYHLLSNAIKYNKPGGRVDIAITRADDRVCISVTDTGKGIPENQRQNIYKPFNRLGREAGPIEGSGIGLAITRQIIETINGDIDCESVEGEGSTFRVTLPIVT